jgi:hypothetical protein
MAPNRYLAYQISSDGQGGYVTITSSFYLLIRYTEVTPKSFVCKSDGQVTEFNPIEAGAGDLEVTQLWDFGPNPTDHCSYSYHMPYGLYALTSSSEPGLAVAADRNPWIEGPGYVPTPENFPLFNPTGGRESVQYGNSPSHQGDSQNVLFVDIHVDQEKTPACGVNDDNIYTYWGGQDPRIGTMPAIGTSPSNRADSYLVNDFEEGGSAPPKGRACFVGETPVWVNGRMVQISKVAAGQTINALAATSVEKLEAHEGTYECRDIVLESGNCISVVESHLFMLDSGQWVKAPS